MVSEAIVYPSARVDAARGWLLVISAESPCLEEHKRQCTTPTPYIYKVWQNIVSARTRAPTSILPAAANGQRAKTAYPKRRG